MGWPDGYVFRDLARLDAQIELEWVESIREGRRLHPEDGGFIPNIVLDEIETRARDVLARLAEEKTPR